MDYPKLVIIQHKPPSCNLENKSNCFFKNVFTYSIGKMKSYFFRTSLPDGIRM